MVKRKTIPFNFSEKHKAYIRKSADCMYNIAEGAIRAGKTVDNVFAFAHELKSATKTLRLLQAMVVVRVYADGTVDTHSIHFFREYLKGYTLMKNWRT